MRAINWLRNEALAALRLREATFFPLMRLFRSQYPLVAPNAEAVIEGFWRSGNTFVVQAFRAAQQRPIRLAYHTHAAASVLRGVRLGLPALVLVRPPLATVSSLLLKHPAALPGQTLREYIAFHRRIWPLHEQFVTATFDEATRDLGLVIDRLNARFGTNFRRFDHRPAAAAEVLSGIEQFDRQANAGDPTKFCTPRPEKQAARVASEAMLQSPRFAKLLAGAEAEYDRFAWLAAKGRLAAA